jgi:hypothetical protein
MSAGIRPTRAPRPFLASLAFTLAACGGGGSTNASVASSTSTSMPSSTTAPATSTSSASATTRGQGTGTTVASSTTVGPGPACPTSPLPANVSNVTTAPGSFDGDGQPDVLRAYQAAGAWHLRAELSAGGQVDVTVPNVATADVVKAVGGFNIDSSAAHEAFATVGAGGYATLVGVWKSGGFCQLTRLTVNGQPSTFPVGSAVANRSGLRCVAGTAIQILDAKSTNGTQYSGTIANYDVSGNTLVLANTSPSQMLAAGDPDLAPYGAFSCGTLSLS